MGWNDIKLNQINARLGDTNKPRQYDSYEDDVSEPRGSDYDGGQDEGTSLNAVFLASVFALFIAVSGGTYMFASGSGLSGILNWKWAPEESTQFVSKAAPFCEPLWKAQEWNDDALACYMVEIPSRFCDAAEKQHLVSMFTRYRTDVELLKAKVIKQFTVGQKDIYNQIKQDIEDQENGVKRVKPKPKPKKQNKYLSNKSFEDNLADFQKKVFNPSLRGRNSELSDLVRKLVLKGYFKADEFGFFRDAIVTDALAEPFPEIKSACKVATM